MIEWMKKNRKELLLPFLCFVLGLLLAIASIQVQEQEYQGGPNTDSFPAKGLQEFGQQGTRNQAV